MISVVNPREREIIRIDLKGEWPHRVGFPAEKVRDPATREVISCAASVVSAAPLTLRWGAPDFLSRAAATVTACLTRALRALPLLIASVSRRSSRKPHATLPRLVY
jgi:hypothetical protein